MKVLVQRVSEAKVVVDGAVVGQIDRGLLVYLGVEKGDTEEMARWYAGRLTAMKWFAGEDGLWRRTLQEVGGRILLVSQFTLAAKTRKGRRPSFDPAETPERAQELYELMAAELQDQGIEVARGVFGAKMDVWSCNDGPVTFLVDGPRTTP